MRIAIEGGEGTGKTTLINILKGIFNVSEVVSEGELKNELEVDIYKLGPLTQTLLFAEYRKQLNKTFYITNKDNLILQDRSIISNLVYQTMDGELSYDDVVQLNQFMDKDFKFPDLVIILDSDPKFNIERLKTNGRELDSMDLQSLEFHKKVREKFLDLSKSRYTNFYVIHDLHNENLDDLIHELKMLVPLKFQ